MLRFGCGALKGKLGMEISTCRSWDKVVGESLIIGELELAGQGTGEL